MIENMTHVMLFVKDYDEALDFYTKKLGFEKITDVSLMPGIRFLTVAPKGQGTEIILHLPSAAMHGEAEAKRMAGLVGKTPALMFKVDDCKKTCDELRLRGNDHTGTWKGPIRHPGPDRGSVWKPDLAREHPK